ncbi:MAG: hypothetical protein A3E82_06975 [Gammaproteobacteria bacterium RIFCSPHIGHO2_12_FULL_38_11]|nr:MAG: hypothetical protein A3E82_06975 [Gammaproteobacteria bacterium RIFCSPHIGHO2_12_FULL_38_11]
MSKYLDPKADIVFKKIFCQHPHLLVSFLNAVLPLPDDQEIVTLSYLPSENVPKIPGLKYSIADVKCTDNHSRTFIVEMQIDWVESFRQRLLFESGHAYVKQLKKKEDYAYLKPVYGLGLIGTNFDPDPDHWYHHYQLVNVMKPEKEIIDQLQLVFIEILKFPVESRIDKKLRILWLRFMREIDSDTRRAAPELLAVPEIKEALELAEEAAYSDAELEAYESYWKQVRTEKTLISGYFQKGLVKGLAEGHEQTMHDIAKKLLTEGVDISIIAACTNLPLNEIDKLKS